MGSEKEPDSFDQIICKKKKKNFGPKKNKKLQKLSRFPSNTKSS